MTAENISSSDSVAAVVVTWNSDKYIEACLDSLASQSHKLDRIVVVDNNSGDRTVEIIAADYPDVQLERRSSNEGFARANNIGIGLTQSDWVLLLNPDARLDKDWTLKLLNKSKDNSGIGILGGKLLRERESPGSPVIDSTGIEIFTSRRVCDRGAGMPDDDRWGRTEQVFGICAAAVLYKREMLIDLTVRGQIFPEYFFSYYEDADLAWRAWRRNWEAWYVPEAVGWHWRGGSTTGARFSRYLTHRNRLWLIARNESLLMPITAVFSLLGHEFLMLLRVMKYPCLWKAVFESLWRLPRAIGDRRLLSNTSHTLPPFRRGVGFTRGQVSSAVSGTGQFTGETV